MKQSQKLKIWLTVPETHEKSLRIALGDAESVYYREFIVTAAL